MTILPKAIYRFNAIPYQNTNGIFHRTKINNAKMFMEPQKTWIANNLEKEKHDRWYHTPWFKTLWHNSNQNGMFLVQTQTQRSEKHNSQCSTKPTCPWSSNVRQRRRIYNRKKTASSIHCGGKWTTTWKRIELDLFLTPYTKINWKINSRLKCKT